jgi:acylphosphatase
MKHNVRAHVIVSGRVQGVFFRAETQKAASRIGVTGWVRNRPEGTVEAVFEVNPPWLTRLWPGAGRGHPCPKWTDVQVEWGEFSGEFESFAITY